MRIGITGLAVVFLVVLLAAAIVGFHSKDQLNGAANGASAGNASEAPPADPLAELGVAPGGTGGDDSAAKDSAPKR